MKTENEIIAEFMGAQILGDNTKVAYWNFGKPNQKTVRIEKLLYHSSWRWLMRVVDKINFLKIQGERIDVIIYRNTCHVNDPRQILIEATGKDMFDSTYKAVLEFINWYNTNPK